MLVDVICATCGKTVQKTVKSVNRNKKSGHKSYCSKGCQTQGSITSVTFYCDNCGREYTRTRGEYGKSSTHFCSMSCRTSYHNRGVIRNFSTGESVEYRPRALKHYGAKCSVCGYDIEAVLEVHHKDCDRSNNEILNLDVLCPTHHKEYQYGVRTYAPIIQPGQNA